LSYLRFCDKIVIDYLPKIEWAWDTSSPLIQHGIFLLSGPDSSIATRSIGPGGGGDPDEYDIHEEDCNNCLMLTPTIAEDDHEQEDDRDLGHVSVKSVTATKQTISFKLLGENNYPLLGLVHGNARWDRDHASGDTDRAWFLYTGNGCLMGKGYWKEQSNAGQIQAGQVLTIQADFHAATLKFWVDGQPSGLNQCSSIGVPMRWAMTAGWKGESVQIVPTPKLEPFPPLFAST
jgi:hypothetical protein